MKSKVTLGLGTNIRLLLSLLDGELAKLYEANGSQFRPKFYPVFQILLDNESATVGEIATFLRTSQPAATQTLNQMRHLGFVEVITGDDRRERHMALTQHGRETANTLQPIWRATARAAQELDRQLSFPLAKIVEEALAELEQESFFSRISTQLVQEANKA